MVKTLRKEIFTSINNNIVKSKIVKCIITLVLLMSVGVANAQLNKRYFYYIGQGLIIDGKYYEAVEILNRLLAVDTLAYDGFFLRGVAKYNLGDYVGAESDFNSAIKVNSVYTTAYQYRAIARSYLGNYNDAVRDFESAIDLRPDNEGLYYSRGITFYMSQQFDRAIADFDYYISKRPLVVDAFINRGSCYLMKQDTVAAFRDYNRAVEINRYNPDGFLRRGSVYFAMNELDSAYNDLTRAIALDSTIFHSYFNRALVHANKNRPIEAISDFSKAIELDTMSSLTYFNRALTYAQVGDYENALEDYDKVEYYSPSNVLLYYNRGGLNMQVGRMEEAEKDFSKAIELYPDFANAYLGRSSVRYQIGDMEGSKSDKLTSDAKVAEYRANLEDSSMLSQYADTSQVFNKLVSFDPDFENKDFENVKKGDVDIKLLPMFRVTFASRGSAEKILNYENESISDFIRQNGIDGDAFAIVCEFSDQQLKKLEQKHKEPTGNKVNWKSLFAYTLVQNGLRQYTTSVNLYDKVIDLNPSEAFLYVNRSVAKSEMIDFIANLDGKSDKLVIDVNPVNRLKNTKRVYDYNDAIKDARKAIAINPDVSQFYYNLGNLLCQNGEHVEAIEQFTKAIELNSYLGEAYFNRGMIQLYLKDTKKGVLDISKAGELGVDGAYDLLTRFR